MKILFDFELANRRLPNRHNVAVVKSEVAKLVIHRTKILVVEASRFPQGGSCGEYYEVRRL